MRRPLPIALAAVTMVAVAACGSAGVETGANSSSEAPLETEAPADGASGDDAATAAEPPAESPSTEAPAAGSTESTAAPAGDGTAAPEPTGAPTTEAPTEALPDDGCSADNAPTATDVADGPPPAIEVRAASASNPLPDLAVRRVNCAGGWVNLKNEIPAARPLLVWFWAPH